MEKPKRKILKGLMFSVQTKMKRKEQIKSTHKHTTSFELFFLLKLFFLIIDTTLVVTIINKHLPKIRRGL